MVAKLESSHIDIKNILNKNISKSGSYTCLDSKPYESMRGMSADSSLDCFDLALELIAKSPKVAEFYLKMSYASKEKVLFVIARHLLDAPYQIFT